MPNVIVIAGPNGAGKSTLAPDLLKKHFSDAPFINADAIAEELTSSKTSRQIAAGRIMLRRMHERANARETFAFETTLSARTYHRFLQDLKQRGYIIQIAYLWLRDVELSIARVAERVRVGGHNIPEATIRRRFDRGRDNFVTLYLPLADAWRLYDASADEPQLIASGDKIEGSVIFNEDLWKEVTKRTKT